MRYLRKIGKRIPGAWPVYKALRRTLWELRALFHGIRTARRRLARGREPRLGGRRFPYQSVPGAGGGGRPDTVRRWRRVSQELRRAGLSVEGRLVLDVGCNSGMMLAEALDAGAAWGLG